MNRCILCDEEFSTMQLHSSAGTIIKDSGCSMYEELLLKRQQLPKEKEHYDELISWIPLKIKTEPIEKVSELYKQINEQRLLVSKIEKRIDFIEHDYLRNFCISDDPAIIKRRKKIEARVLV